MRDTSNVIAFTLALKFAFIVIQLVAISPWSHYVIRKLFVRRAPATHGDCFRGTF